MSLPLGRSGMPITYKRIIDQKPPQATPTPAASDLVETASVNTDINEYPYNDIAQIIHDSN